jgi:Rrf2 family protein
MTVIFSKKCEYGIQAVLYLASRNPEKMISAEEISKELKIPKEFVSKILQNLTSGGIIESRKGKGGGFSLAKSSHKIKLLEVVESIDGLDVFNSCVLGFPNCDSKNPCPVHNTWGKLRDEAYNMLNDQTLKELKESTLKKLKSL